MTVTSGVSIEQIPVVVCLGQKPEFRTPNSAGISATVQSIQLPETFNPRRRLTIRVKTVENRQTIPQRAEVWTIE